MDQIRLVFAMIFLHFEFFTLFLIISDHENDPGCNFDESDDQFEDDDHSDDNFDHSRSFLDHF